MEGTPLTGAVRPEASAEGRIREDSPDGALRADGNAPVRGAVQGGSVRVRLLGEVGAAVDGHEVDLGAARQRALFAVLAMRANEVVSRGELIRAVWGADVPATVESSVYTYVGRLRRALEPSRSPRSPSALILQDGPGYRFRIPAHGIDVHRFVEHAQEGRRRRIAGDIAGALAEFDAALELWGGEALAGLDGPFAEAERTRLEELRISATEDGLSALIDLGRSDEAVAELLTLKRHHPFRERVRALLMLALSECGRRAEALGEFGEIRARLVDDLGIDPGAELLRAHEAVLRQAAPGPSAATSNGGEGRGPSQLPMEVAGFVGREEETERLHRMVSEASEDTGGALTVIDGLPGSGKSALAVRLAHRIAEGYPDGQLYVDMSGGPRPEGALTAEEARRILLGGLGVEDRSGSAAGPEERFAAYRSALAGRRVLLLLDNVLSADQVRPLLPGGSSWNVLVTSRSRMSGLAVKDGAGLMTLGPLAPEESVVLMERVIRRAGGMPVERGTLRAIAALCGHLPAALRVGAVRLATMGAGAVEAVLRAGNPLDFLDAEIDRAESIRADMSVALGALSPKAERLFVALGRAEEAHFDAAEAARLAGAPSDSVLGVLDELVRANLIEPGAHGRFRMNRLIHAYARERASAEPRSAVTGPR